MHFARQQALGLFTAVALLFAAPAQAKPEKSFSFNTVVEQAKMLATQDYVKPTPLQDDWLGTLNYDSYRDIIFRNEKSYWREARAPFQLQFFHLGTLYLTPVEIYEVAGGTPKRIPYQSSRFNYGNLPVPADINQRPFGYPGFRVIHPLNRADKWDELLVFLGASYFRSLGKDQHYGLSARGLAIDTASAKGEEFPDFRKFWLLRPGRSERELVIYALLDSPSVTGAYRFVVRPGLNVVMDVTAKLFARKDIDKLGIAPLTSMYAHGENNNRLKQDFRPEVHDSDGLLMKNGNGEWLWRPINNPATLSVSTFSLENAGGFGLLQRDRAFSSYQDLEAHYEARPSLWVEPKGKWGRGAVQLVEIPTDSEIHDNIVAYWVPEKPLQAGQNLDIAYRLSWGTPPAATGRGLEVASSHVGQQFSSEKTKFIIDFAPPAGAKPARLNQPAPEIWSSAGEISAPAIMPNPQTGGWRVAFDLAPDRATVYELRCVLREGNKTVSETWTYQWHKD
jgi:periplasmic glucans biosynthesis protein